MTDNLPDYSAIEPPADADPRSIPPMNEELTSCGGITDADSPSTIFLGYMLLFSIYSMLLGMISVTMTPGIGLGLCLVAAMLVFAVGADRYHDLGILYHPGYDDPGWGSGNDN